MEALQMLKFAYHSEDSGLDFTADILTSESELTMGTDEDLLGTLISAQNEDSI
jgi:hypothetical protein